MRITYLFDPLCGWCYGAAAALEAIVRIDGAAVHLAPTGLFAGGNGRPMDAAFANFAWQNDQRIARQTGQVFSDAYRALIFDTPGTMFDSALATLGIVAAGLIQADHEPAALKALQRARYVDGRNTADPAVVADVLVRAGFADAAARVLSMDPALLDACRRRIEDARRMMARFGAQGVPALVVEDDRGARLVPSRALFADPDTLTTQLRAA